MKFQSNTLLPLLTRADMSKLTRITEETPDVLKSKNSKSNLSAAGLWMIHKQRRNFRTRNFI